MTSKLDNGLYEWVPGPQLPMTMFLACVVPLNLEETEHLLISAKSDNQTKMAKAWTYDWNEVKNNHSKLEH